MTEFVPRILAIDDDKMWLEQIPLIFEDYLVDGVPTIDQGLQEIESSFYDIILLDLNFIGDNRTGLDVFRRINAADSGADVIVLSAEPNKDKMIEIFNAGVTQYISKPASNDVIRAAVEKTLEIRRAKRRALEHLANDPDGTPLVGSSLAIQKVRELTSNLIAGGAKDILLQGESGTGKEVLAKYIAYATDPSCRLVTINCAAINDGLVESNLFGHVKGSFSGADRDRPSPFELATGGFVFLDEIGDMPILQQPKLLRVLQERKLSRVGSDNEVAVNFKVIAATNVNIDEAVLRGKFREDLLYRIAKHRINLPPLRERPEDIPELVHYFLSLSPVNKRKQITQDALNLLQAFSWPGNVRQLKSIVENAELRTKDGVIRDKEICQALPEVAKIKPATLVSLAGRYGTSLIVSERRRFEKALVQANNDREEAAKLLGISRATFFRKAKDLGLVKERKPKGVNL